MLKSNLIFKAQVLNNLLREDLIKSEHIAQDFEENQEEAEVMKKVSASIARAIYNLGLIISQHQPSKDSSNG